jgi:hypothetical protein
MLKLCACRFQRQPVGHQRDAAVSEEFLAMSAA